MSAIVNLVEFELNNELYALDIELAREIVEMMPITSIPRSPPYISGVINLRGEITSIVNLNMVFGIPDNDGVENKKIIVLVPDAGTGGNMGIIVDDVQSVVQVSQDSIYDVGASITSDINAYVKGIIKIGNEAAEEKKKDLIIWIDIKKLLKDLVNQQQING